MSCTGPAAAGCLRESMPEEVWGAKPPKREGEDESEEEPEGESLSLLLRRLVRVCRARRAKPRSEAVAAVAATVPVAAARAAACAAFHPAAAVAMVCVARIIVAVGWRCCGGVVSARHSCGCWSGGIRAAEERESREQSRAECFPGVEGWRTRRARSTAAPV